MSHKRGGADTQKVMNGDMWTHGGRGVAKRLLVGWKRPRIEVKETSKNRESFASVDTILTRFFHLLPSRGLLESTVAGGL